MASLNIYIAKELFNKNNGDKAIAIDPSHISKSGKHPHDFDYLGSGVANLAKYGLEILEISLIETKAHQSMHLLAKQTPCSSMLEEEDQTQTTHHLEVIKDHMEKLKEISNIIVADVWFSKCPFVDELQGLDFVLVSRFSYDAALKYLYKGENTGKEEGPKVCR